mgnify:CR=1 FL=1|tara:strand:- start:48793 stop:49440 length:648 start_codon:yes stop_codon:yes gene_type:complete
MGLVVEDWGQLAYEEAYARQLKTVKARLADTIPDTLIFTEHPPVYTLGRRKDAQKNLLLEKDALEAKGIQLVQTNRGGDITYHGPGQIVGYPIIHLKARKDLHAYLRDLEQVIINTLGCLGLAAARRPEKTGIWLENRKIAAIGVAVKQWVSYHGFALNAVNDLSPFGDIIPCGIDPEEGTVTSIAQELGRTDLDLEELKAIIKAEFQRIFYAEN